MHTMIIKKAVIIFLLVLTISCSQQNHQNTSANPVNEDKVPVKVVIVTMFEIGADEGDEIGEFQLWKERRELNKKFEFPQSHHDLFYNSETQTLGMVTGIGTANSAAAIMALGLDPRFDLSRAYWLVAGIAGIDPEDASIGSVVWSSFLVDGDLGYELDAREIPDDWSTGYLHFDTSTPFETPRPKISGEGRAYCCHKEVFVANPLLRDWAYEKTQDLKLFDEESLWDTRNLYSEHPNARKAPEVLKGGHIAAMTFWHGELKNKWANELVSYWTDGATDFVTSAMEETGTFQSLTYLDRIDKVDIDRALVLRGGSNFTMQPPNLSAAENLMKESEGYAGLEVSLENIYLAGSVVLDELIANWDTYETQIPSMKKIKTE